MTEKDREEIYALKTCKRTQKSITPMNYFMKNKDFVPGQSNWSMIWSWMILLILPFRFTSSFYHPLQCWASKRFCYLLHESLNEEKFGRGGISGVIIKYKDFCSCQNLERGPCWSPECPKYRQPTLANWTDSYQSISSIYQQQPNIRKGS